jgi:hypothetical protein
MNIEEVWSDEEEPVIRALYLKLAEKFGITLINNHLTLRFTEGCVNLIITGVQPGQMHVDSCHLCGCHNQLKPATVELTHANDSKTMYETMTCVDCRCPQ